MTSKASSRRAISLIVYTSTDDTGFTFIAAIPVGQDVKNFGKNMSMGQSPEGKSLKFVHRGSYDNMDNTYEAITNHLDEKKLEAKDLFIEEYIDGSPEDGGRQAGDRHLCAAEMMRLVVPLAAASRIACACRRTRVSRKRRSPRSP